LPLLPPPVSKELVARWAERRTAARGASETTRGKTRRGAWDNMLEIVGGFHRAGGAVLAGTDCPNVAIVSGYSLHRELELLVRAGLSPMEAIISATRRPAASGWPGGMSSGTIAPGRYRRSVVLGADPIAGHPHVRVVSSG